MQGTQSSSSVMLSIVSVQIPPSQTTAPMSGAGSSIEDAIKSTSTVENMVANPASEAAVQSAGTTGSPASSFADKMSEGAGKLTEQGGSLPDAATSASQAAPGAIEAAGKDACVPANRTCRSHAETVTTAKLSSHRALACSCKAGNSG